MLTVWKFHVPMAPRFEIQMPVGARILSAQTQHGEAQIWALVDSAAITEARRFHLLGTGHPVDGVYGPSLRYVDTIQIEGGSLVFHIFEEIR